MQMSVTKKMALILFGIVYLIFPQTIFAYLDPGTGSYILQIVLAAIVGAAFTIKLYWTKVKSFVVNLFTRRSKK